MVFSDFFLLTFKGSDKMGKKTPAGGSIKLIPPTDDQEEDGEEVDEEGDEEEPAVEAKDDEET